MSELRDGGAVLCNFFFDKGDIPVFYDIFPAQKFMVFHNGTMMGAIWSLIQYFNHLLIESGQWFQCQTETICKMWYDHSTHI